MDAGAGETRARAAETEAVLQSKLATLHVYRAEGIPTGRLEREIKKLTRKARAPAVAA